MNVKKYFAGSSREALRQIKLDLGADALILSNKQVPGGVEIVAFADSQAQAAMAQASAQQQTQQQAPAEDVVAAVQAAAPAAPGDPMVARLMQEIVALRGMVEERLAGLAWSDLERREPVRAELMRDLLRAGFSAALARRMLENMPVGRTVQSGMEWIRSALELNLQIAKPENDPIEHGGVFAIVGPTGVGKTTTTAKLAARCVLRHGAAKLALLTTDSYRIGAHEQLRIYGKMLGTPVHAVKDTGDLNLLLGEVRHKHLVLIDTVGMGQRDTMLAEHAAMLNGSNVPIRRLLLLNASASGETLEEVVRNYKKGGIDGCILSKADEAVSLGNVLDTIIRHGLVLYGVGDGQRVPEDLHAPDRTQLVRDALTMASGPSPHSLSADEVPLMLAGLSATRSLSDSVPMGI